MFRIGVDIGGTFTDLYALDESNPTRRRPYREGALDP